MKTWLTALLLICWMASNGWTQPTVIVPGPTNLTAVEFGVEVILNQVSLEEAGRQYLVRYPDVAADSYYRSNPYQHWLDHGQYEGWRMWWATNQYLPDAFLPSRGVHAHHFPKGARIYEIDLQIMINAAIGSTTLVYWCLILSPDGRGLYQSANSTQTNTEIKRLAPRTIKPGDQPQTVNLRPNGQVVIPPGWYMQIYCDGWGSGVSELQGTVFVQAY